jgi:hypothetical protein
MDNFLLDKLGQPCIPAITDLKKSGLDAETVKNACITVFNRRAEELKKELGYANFEGLSLLQNTNLLRFPYFDEHGKEVLARFKPVPQIDENRKYLHPLRTGAIPYILPSVWEVKNKVNKPIWITEGEKKALKLIQHGRNAIALPGVWAFKAGKHSSFDDLSKEFWPQLRQFDWRGRSVFLAFDMDLWTNPQVRYALYELGMKLMSFGANVMFPKWIEGKGIDDFLVLQADPAGALTTLEDKAVTLGEFAQSGHEAEITRALAVVDLSPMAAETITKAVAKGCGVSSATVKRQVAALKGKKEGGMAAFFERFYQIDGEEIVFDLEEKRQLSVRALTLRYPSLGKVWKDSDNKKALKAEQIVFKPQGCSENEVNLFTGLDLTPAPGCCDKILELLHFLCESDPDLVRWVTSWLAYPLQHLGAKMQTALIVQGAQGTGKSKFFEQAMRKIYGRYFSYVTQEQLEEKFNEWASQKLYICCDEVVANRNLGKLKNTIKSAITQPTINIRRMRQVAINEENHANFVFLSNEDVPILIDDDDRRVTVLACDKNAPKELMIAVDAELANGGDKAFMKYLMEYDTGDFNEFTPPFETDAKERLRLLCAKAPEKFIRAWQNGDLEFPFCCCEKSDLFVAFKLWVEFSDEYGNASLDNFNSKVQVLINRGIIRGIKDGKVNVNEWDDEDESVNRRASKRAWKVSIDAETIDAFFPGLWKPSQAQQIKVFKEKVADYRKMVAASKAF